MHRTLPIRSVVVGLVAAVASLTVLAGPASALPPPVDNVRLVGINADFGDNTWVNNAPVGSGTLTYDVSSGTTITARLVGFLHVNNARGMHTRMQMRYFDVFGTELATRVGGTVTADDNDHHVWSVNLAPYSNPAVYRVNVSTTYEGSTGWLTIAATNYYV